MRDLAKRIGVCQPIISRWYTGKREPKIHQIETMAKVFGVSVQWLTFGSETVNNQAVIIHRSGAITADKDFSLVISREASKRIFQAVRENLSLFNLGHLNKVPIDNTSNLFLVDMAVHEITAVGLYLVDIGSVLRIRRMQPFVHQAITPCHEKNSHPNQGCIDATKLKESSKVIASICISVF